MKNYKMKQALFSPKRHWEEPPEQQGRKIVEKVKKKQSNARRMKQFKSEFDKMTLAFIDGLPHPSYITLLIGFNHSVIDNLIQPALVKNQSIFKALVKATIKADFNYQAVSTLYETTIRYIKTDINLKKTSSDHIGDCEKIVSKFLTDLVINKFITISTSAKLFNYFMDIPQFEHSDKSIKEYWKV